MTTKFKHNGQEYSITIGYPQAMFTLPEKFQIYLLKMFVDETSAMSTINNLLLDEEKAVNLMWHYIEPEASFDFNSFLERLKEKEVSEFRDAFWLEVENFSGPLKKNLLQDMWKTMKKEIKNASLQSTSENSTLLFSEPNPEESK